MDSLESSKFGIIDYCFFAAMLLVSTSIGVYTSLRGNKSPEEFLMGNRSFSPLPIAMSLVTSFVSAISLLGFSGETYAYGMQIFWFIPGAALGIMAAAITTLPVLQPLELTSANEYIELRFGSPNLRKAVTAITTINGLVYMGVCLYAPTLALAAVTPLSSKFYIFILGFVVTLYSSIGGIRAVVWTDVFQLTVMFIGLFVVVGVGIYEAGGLTHVWNTAMAGGRLEIFVVDPSIYVRHNIWNTFGNGFIYCASFFGVSQINVQRICAVPTMLDARRVLIITSLGMILIYTLIFSSGTIAYSAFAGCDPWARGLLEKKDEIIPYFVSNRLNYVTGLPGIFVATIIGGALSSLSSVMNAVVAMVWKDFCSERKMFEKIRPTTAGIINKILSFVIGGIAIGTALLSSSATSLIQFTLTVGSVTFGPIFGVFLLGLFFPRTNMIGVWAGIIVSLLLTGWISAGAFMYAPSYEPLSFSAENCSTLLFNTSDVITGREAYDFDHLNTTSKPLLEDEPENDFPLMKLYGISYALYATVGVFSCLIIALILSCLTGNQDLKNVTPKYVSPLVRKFYWNEADPKSKLWFNVKNVELMKVSSPSEKNDTFS